MLKIFHLQNVGPETSFSSTNTWKNLTFYKAYLDYYSKIFRLLFKEKYPTASSETRESEWSEKWFLEKRPNFLGINQANNELLNQGLSKTRFDKNDFDTAQIEPLWVRYLIISTLFSLMIIVKEKIIYRFPRGFLDSSYFMFWFRSRLSKKNHFQWDGTWLSRERS